MKITKHKQSCFLIETEGLRILIDPGTYFFGEELDFNNFVKIDIVIVTHEHSDHFDQENIGKILKESNPLILAPESFAPILKEKFPASEIICIKPKIVIKQGDVSLIGALSKHGPLPNGKPTPEVVGILIDDGHIKFYSPGDSVELDHGINADVVATPICGQVVMDLYKAKKELLKLKPKIAIPMHYDSPKYPVDVNQFVTLMSETDISVNVLSENESIEL